MTTALFREGKNSYTKTPFMVFKNYTSTCSKCWPICCMLYYYSLAVVKDQLMEAKMSVNNCLRLKRDTDRLLHDNLSGK